MAFDLSSISKAKRERAPRIVLCGIPKIGKSTFAASAPSPIFIPIVREEGIDALDVDTFPVCRSFDDVMSAIGVLYASDHQFQTVVVDSLSALEPLIWAETCKRNGNVDSIEKVGGGFAKGYTEALSLVRELLDGFDALRNDKNMTIIFVAHVKVKAFSDPLADAFDQYQLSIHEKAAAVFDQWADVTLFASYKTLVKSEDMGFNKKKKRAVSNGNAPVLFTQKRPAHPGGGRGVYGQLPYELPLEWDAFAEAVAEAGKAA